MGATMAPAPLPGDPASLTSLSRAQAAAAPVWDMKPELVTLARVSWPHSCLLTPPSLGEGHKDG
jgi:hypothetical protein